MKYEPQTPFEGYVVAKMEAMSERLDNLPCVDHDKRINTCTNDISNIQGKATVIGSLAGIVSAFITKYILLK